MKYASLIPLLLLLLTSCGDILERPEWHDGVYSFSEEDTTTLISLYHNPYYLGTSGLPPTIILNLDERQANTEKQLVTFNIYIVEGDNGEYSSKEIYTNHNDLITYKGKTCSLTELTLTAAGVTLKMTYEGKTESIQLHKLRDWNRLHIDCSKTYEQVTDSGKLIYSFNPKESDKYLLQTSYEDANIEDLTSSLEARYITNVDNKALSTVFRTHYSLEVPINGKEYSDISFHQTYDGLTFTGVYTNWDSEKNEVIIDTFSQVLPPVK